MFDSPVHAQSVLNKMFGEERARLMLPLLSRCLRFRRILGIGDTMGSTRLGGLPDVAEDFQWPCRPTRGFDSESYWNGRFPAVAEERRRYVSRGLPYMFLAQIDLEAVAKLNVPELPTEGRLLFFYDFVSAIGDPQWSTAAKVMWDRTPRADLRLAKPPQALIDCAWDDVANAPPERPAALPSCGTSFNIPVQHMVLETAYRLQHPLGSEAWNTAALREHFEVDGNFENRYHDLADIWRDDPPDGHQMLGVPFPIQWDVRQDVAWVLKSEGFASEAVAEAATWRLLLQINVLSLNNSGTSGMIYVLLSEKGLIQRDFSNVIAAMQWT